MTGGRVRLRVGAVLVAALLCLLWSEARASAALTLGGLTQLPGTAGCFTSDGNSEDGSLTCSSARAITDAESAELSPDSANLYVGSAGRTGVEPGLAIFSRSHTTGALTQLSGISGCFTPDGRSVAGPGTCATAHGLISAPGDGHDLAFSSNGRWVYMVAQNSAPHGAILIFKRDPGTGALTQVGCISGDGSGGACQNDGTLAAPTGISMSSDDRFVYVVDPGPPRRVHVYYRDTVTGALTQNQCLSEGSATPCSSGGLLAQTGRALGQSEELAISADGLHAYGGDYSTGLSVFDRNPATGVLTQKPGTGGCLSDDGKDDAHMTTCTPARVTRGVHSILISPNGTTLYATSFGFGFSVFHINPDGSLMQLPGIAGCTTTDGSSIAGPDTCATGRAISSAYGGTISSDGRSLYLSSKDASAGGVAVFSLEPASGLATQVPGLAGCVTSDGSADGKPGVCVDGTALSTGAGITISPDGRYIYQATRADMSAGLAIFGRETAPRCTATSAATAFGTGVAVSLRCADPDGDPVTVAIASGPVHGAVSAGFAGSTVIYTPSAGYSGRDSFSFNASDGTNTSGSQNATITIGGFGGVTLTSSRLSLNSRGITPIKLHCPPMAAGRSCVVVADLFSPTGQLPATASAVTIAAGAAAARKPAKAALLGRGRFTIAAGKTVVAHVHLGRAGRSFAAMQPITFKVRLLLTGSVATAVRTFRYNATIKQPPRPKQKPKKKKKK